MHEIANDDGRIHYFRQQQNIGAIANFEFVLKKAKGKYFIWVADDDLCEGELIEKLVDCMELHRDLVLCACDVQSIDEYNRPLETNRLESIRLSVDWVDARKLFFRYPTSNIFFSIYGLFKTEVLNSVGADLSSGWRGLATNGEVPFLAKIALKGRIASIPEVLKIYRRHPDSCYYKELKTLSRFNTGMLRFMIRFNLCRIALRSELPFRAKLSLLNTVLVTFIPKILVLERKIIVSGQRMLGKIKLYVNKLSKLLP